MQIPVGILIVGSLYWDTHCNRTKWRHERLEIGASQGVVVPIRYGRRSQSRGKSYTMVFSRSLLSDWDSMGKAVVVPCKRSVCCIKDFLQEAEALWAAERNVTTSNGRISADWGAVAVALNPDHTIPEEFLEGWHARVSEETNYGQFDKAAGEEPIFNKKGILEIPWPKCSDGAPLQVSALLATATNPTLINGKYATPRQIAAAWTTDSGSKYVEYFWKNRESAINTFQDGDIEAHLNGGISS